MQEEFTLAELARLLSRKEKQIRNDAENGVLEGHKIQNNWVFSLNAVVDYIGKYIITGIGDEELVKLVRIGAGILKKENSLTISSLLSESTILLPLLSHSPKSVIADLTRKAQECGKLWDADKMASAIEKRESMISTAMDNGVALLHPRRPMPKIVPESFIMLGIAPRGIPFGGGFNNLTDIFFMICSTDDTTHLHVMAKLARLFKQKGFVNELRELTDAREIITLFEKAEKNIK